MKITNKQLRKIIKEELSYVMESNRQIQSQFFYVFQRNDKFDKDMADEWDQPYVKSYSKFNSFYLPDVEEAITELENNPNLAAFYEDPNEKFLKTINAFYNQKKHNKMVPSSGVHIPTSTMTPSAYIDRYHGTPIVNYVTEISIETLKKHHHNLKYEIKGKGWNR